MGLNAEDDILQDFLVEAAEIVEQLGEQLVDLEQHAGDAELLNAIFRGFHTIKGGAGFLGIDPLVATCHCAEDVFNSLRQGQRVLTPDLMDAILQALDKVNAMMDALRAGEAVEPADPDLLERLTEVNETGPADYEVVGSAPTDDAIAASGELDTAPSGDEIAEEEFDALLNALHGNGQPVAAQASAASGAAGEMSDDEFEALLDDLHGKGRHRGKPVAANASADRPAEVASATASTAGEANPGTGDKAADPSRIAATKGAQAETTVRVDTQRLDNIMNLVGELVLVRNRLSTLRSSHANDELATAIANLDVVTADLQLAVMKTRMQPVKKVFGRFPRVVRDLARNLNKEVDLVLQGEDTDLDKNLVEALADPLVHLVRNAIDHGIEAPEQRERLGKPRRGRVVLSAAQQGDHILLSIDDDGRGMDSEVLRSKAVEKQVMDEEAAARLDPKGCYNLIFHPGFSTKEEISDVSGRGVGMDVVKTRITQINGTVEIDSEPGRGSRITIKLPLTLAILPTLMVILDQQPFALPLASVVEIFNLDPMRTNTVDGQLTVRLRDRALPLFYLRDWLVAGTAGDHAAGHQGHVVVVNVGGIQVGLVVDCLVGQEEVVIKPLGTLLQGLEGMAGATITGDGKIALILDVPGLMRKYARRH